MEKQKQGWNYNAIIIVFLIGVSVFSVYKYIYSIKERYVLVYTLSREKFRLALLETQKNELARKLEDESALVLKLKENNLLYKDSLIAGKKKVLKLAIAYQEAYNLGKALDSQITFLNSENSRLKVSTQDLQFKVSEAVRENESLQTKLSSAKEIKKVIREVKKKEREAVVKVTEKTEVKQIVQPTKINNSVKGNGGFLLKNRMSNYIK